MIGSARAGTRPPDGLARRFDRSAQTRWPSVTTQPGSHHRVPSWFMPPPSHRRRSRLSPASRGGVPSSASLPCPPSWREPVAKATLSGRPTTAGRDPPGVTPRPRGRVPGSGRGCDDGEGTGTERVAVAPALQRGPAVADVRLLQADGNRGAGRAGHGRIVGAVPDPRRGPCAGRPRLYRRRGAFATWSTRACG